MKKRDWKKRALKAERQAEIEVSTLSDDLLAANEGAYGLRLEVDALTRELEDKRKNWAPIKIKHPYVPRDAGCRYCDDPAEDPRHG